MGKAERRKGHDWERAVARMHREALPGRADMIKRGSQSRKGDDAPDVDVDGLLWVECKVGERPNILGAWKQATEARGNSSAMRVVVSKRDGEKPLATVSLDSWLKILKMLHTMRADHLLAHLDGDPNEQSS